ncbi:MAG TPA: VCBS repeat-containing protein, partial [Vicinamibacterales bacterium]|nr:VCBS repeat-containing protein [Vicinamibacterales bacterium]
MRLRAAFAKLLSWAAVSAALFFQPATALADAVYADFDRDGKRDVVSIVPGSKSTLQVWLSATQTLRHLRLSRPVLRVVALDLDGDGRPEIVASDTDAR